MIGGNDVAPLLVGHKDKDIGLHGSHRDLWKWMVDTETT